MMQHNPARERALKAAALTPEQLRAGAPPGIFSGALGAPFAGVGAGLAQASGLLYGAAGALARGYNQVLGWQDTLAGLAGLPVSAKIGTDWLAAQRDNALNVAQSYKPDPLRTGLAGHVMFELSRVMTQVAPALATGGAGLAPLAAGAATTGTATSYSKYYELKGEGVDDTTAMHVAAIEGLATGGGVMMPASIGYKVGANIAYGAGANIALGVTERGSVHNLLKDNYPVMAAHYRPLEASALIAEGALGAIFGAVGARAGLRHKAPEIVDAALAARDARHAAMDTAPGIPADPATANAHAKALNAAVDQLLNGQPVDVSGTGIVDGQFVPRPRDTSAGEAVREHYHGNQPVRRNIAVDPVHLNMPSEFSMDNNGGRTMADLLPAIRKFARERFAGKTVVNDLDGSEIQIPWQGIKHSLSGKVSRAVAAAATQIDAVIRRAVPVWSGKDKAGRQHIQAVHFYDVPVIADGKNIEIRLIVREANNGKRYYDHFELKGSQVGDFAPGDMRSIQEVSEASVSSDDGGILPRNAAKNQDTIHAPAWEVTKARNSASLSNEPLRVNDPQGNGRPPETSQAVTSQSGVSDTGISSTSAKRVPSGNDSGNMIAGITEPPDASLPLTAARATDDPETRAGLALLEEKGDMALPVELEDGEIAHVSLQDALREADYEASYIRPDTLGAAVVCALGRG